MKVRITGFWPFATRLALYWLRRTGHRRSAVWAMMPAMFDPPSRTKPGLFVTGTDTDVGKTVVCCGIAAAMRERDRRLRLGVLKPFATGCRRDREGLVNEDAEALAHFADCRLPLDVINPIRFRAPMAPAVAAEMERQAVDWPALSRSLELLDERTDSLLVEGVGGLMVPLDPRNPRYMVGQLAASMGYPVLVVCRSGLGTLNHTAMTVELLRQAGCRVTGLVMNQYVADVAERASDPSLETNRQWLERLTGTKVIAVVPRGRSVQADKARLDPAVIHALGSVSWSDFMSPPGKW